MLVVIMFVIGESEGVPEGIVNDVCGLGAVPLGKAEGESEELSVGPIDGCAAGSVDVNIDGVLPVEVGVEGGPADGFVFLHAATASLSVD